MSWKVTRKKIEALLEPYGFNKAPEVFDIEKLPSTFIDGVFSVQVSEMSPNTDGHGDTMDRFFPTQRVKISASYDVLNGNQDAYDDAIDRNQKIVQILIDPHLIDEINVAPINLLPDVRIVGFSGSKMKFFKDQNNFLIIDNTFDFQVQVTFPPTI